MVTDAKKILQISPFSTTGEQYSAPQIVEIYMLDYPDVKIIMPM